MSPISEWDLIESFLLGITDVGSNDFFERQRLVILIGEDLNILVGLDRELPADSVLNGQNRGVDRIESKRRFERRHSLTE